MKNRQTRAFTLIELITVIAITAVMMTLIIIPVVQSFNLTRIAQGFTDAQQTGRFLIETITREVSNSAGVRDNDGYGGQIAIVVPGNDGTPVTKLFDYAKIDLYQPAAGDPLLRGPSGAFINLGTGHEDPTLKAPMGQPNLPVAPGTTMTRWWIGLKEPLNTDDSPRIYENPYVDYRRTDGTRWMIPNGRENLVVVYRAQIPAYIPNPGGTGFILNPDFFGDADGDGLADLDDPYFFTLNPPGQPPLNGAALAAKINRIRNWKRAAEIMTPHFRYDSVQVLINKSSRQLLLDGNEPRMLSLIEFRPTAIANEPAEGATATRLGEEDDASFLFGPDSFRTTKGSWSSAVVRMYPSDYDSSNPARNEYLIARLDNRAGARGWRIYLYDPDLDADGDDRNGEGDPSDDLEIFDIRTYELAVANGLAYPFAEGIAAANARSGFMSTARGMNGFRAFFPDLAAGKVTTSIGIDKWGTPGGPLRVDKNQPTVDTGPFLSPVNDTALGGNFYDAAYNSINKKFNKVWADNPSLQVNGGVHRFIDLRVTPSPDGTPSPLHPDPNIGFRNARIVPGSEVVIGPDQNPGPNYGNPIRYTRVTQNPSRNQYRINVVDVQEPNWAANGWPTPPANYDATNFVSAILQPRYKAGYIQLNSDPNVPLPPGTVTVYYRVQFTGNGDTVTVDYDTREEITVLLTLRNFPQASLPNPQNITLKGTASIRNALR